MIRYSKKRAAILDAIRGTDCHPSAEWIYQTLKPTHPDLSLGTVYRNLIFFQEHGDIRSIGVVKGQERFDAMTTPHSHFVCSECGAVSDLPEIKPDLDLDRAVSRRYGHAVSHHDLIFYGRCKACMQGKTIEEELLS